MERFSASGDFTVFDDLTTVSVSSPDGSQTAANVAARQFLQTARELPLEGPAAVQIEDRVWELYAATLGTVTPAPGYCITDAGGVKWSVLSLAVVQWGGLPLYYRAACRKQV
jgi:hypothetical protein